MEICSDNHDEIVFESRYCPLCACIEELDDMKTQVDDYYIQLEAIQDKYTELVDLVQKTNPELLV